MTQFVAALPMYDWPERRAEVDAEWAAIRDRLRTNGVDAPDCLARRNADLPPVPGGIRNQDGAVIAPDPAALAPDEFDLATLWRHPALLLGQTCWGPMQATGLAARVTVVGQPDYSDVEGGQGTLYSSAIVMRAGDFDPRDIDGNVAVPPPPLTLPHKGEGHTVSSASHDGIEGLQLPTSPSPLRGGVRGGGGVPAGQPQLPLHLLHGARLAFNEPHSMSGRLALMADLQAAGQDLSIFSQLIETGGHRLSIRAVAEGRADVATIDCRSWALARRYEPAAKGLSVVGWTASRPGLPFVAAAQLPPSVRATLALVLASVGSGGLAPSPAPARRG